VNKKEAKKTLIFSLGRWRWVTRAKRGESFLVLFFKKELLALV